MHRKLREAPDYRAAVLFLNYARYRGELTPTVAAAVPPVANWSMTSIPRGIRGGFCAPAMASSTSAHRMGRRDYAIGNSRSHVWDYGRVKWPFSNSMTLTGKARRGERPRKGDQRTGPCLIRRGRAQADPAYLRHGRPLPTPPSCRFCAVKAPIGGFLGRAPLDRSVGMAPARRHPGSRTGAYQVRTR